MCVYDTEQNGRLEFTKRTLDGLEWMLSANEQPFLIVDNASFEPTRTLLDRFAGIGDNVQVLHLPENLGTAGGLNEGIKRLEPGQHLLKIDNDVVVHTPSWIDDMEFTLERMPEIGMIAAKRRDLIETPYNNEGPFKSTLHMVTHNPGEKWLIVEQCQHIMGTCVMYSSKLIERIGGFYQFDVYGFEDSLYSYRSMSAGFINCFLPHIEIDHIDPGGHPYQKEKEAMASKYWDSYTRTVNEIIRGERSYYFDINEKATVGL